MDGLIHTFDVFNGWLAMVLITHSALSIFFTCFLIFIFCLLVWSQFTNPEFDIMDMVYTFDKATKRKSISPAKALLVGTFITSTYYVIRHDSDGAFTAYLVAWVTNGGIYVLGKRPPKPEPIPASQSKGVLS
jgi:hypothetical protein